MKNLISIENIEGINGVLGLPNLKSSKNVSEKRFELVDIFQHIEDKKELDSLLSYSKNIKFYSGGKFLNTSGAINFLITIDKNIKLS